MKKKSKSKNNSHTLASMLRETARNAPYYAWIERLTEIAKQGNRRYEVRSECGPNAYVRKKLKKEGISFVEFTHPYYRERYFRIIW